MKRLGEFSVTQVVLQDGFLYFLIILVLGALTAVDALIRMLTNSINGNLNTSLVLIIPFFNILPNMLISHLMLHLRTFSSPEAISKVAQSSAGQQYSGLCFATNSFLGNIGAPLDSGDNDKEEWDDERNVSSTNL
ncbi:hypothetical protein GYMLUDRAFT_963094 [Collybiopsis luxurians FD-317 M1]|uniref:Uncharacterized protein n=1 Tax=Collybiopsis luxurians FD-317 M1 TaxID=944289 RepID=A0A0D0CCT2_9AGAR|nr:hypothetical protein GYMLUDRAFT_963094 [Collybiopsis luxurians FD-317 M1]